MAAAPFILARPINEASDPANGVPDDQHDNRADDRDKQAIEVEAGYPHVSELIEKPSTYHRADDSEHDVQQQAFAALVHDFAADKPC